MKNTLKSEIDALKERERKQVNDLEVLLTNADHDYSKQRDEVKSLTVELNDLRSDRESLNVDMTSKEAEILLLNERISNLSNQLDSASCLNGDLIADLRSKLDSADRSLLEANSSIQSP